MPNNLNLVGAPWKVKHEPLEWLKKKHEMRGHWSRDKPKNFSPLWKLCDLCVMWICETSRTLRKKWQLLLQPIELKKGTKNRKSKRKRAGKKRKSNGRASLSRNGTPGGHGEWIFPVSRSIPPRRS